MIGRSPTSTRAVRLSDGRLEVGDDARARPPRDRLPRMVPRSLRPASMKQIADERSHTRRGVEHSREIVARLLVEPRPERRGEPFAERRDLAQGLLKVVRGDKRELVEGIVRPLQLHDVACKTALREPSFGDVFDCQQNDARQSGPCVTSRAFNIMIFRPIRGNTWSTSTSYNSRFGGEALAQQPCADVGMSH